MTLTLLRRIFRCGTAVVLAGMIGACAARPPTIAHTHLGHAVTAVHVTPEKEGYMIVAEKRAQRALELSATATSDTANLDHIKASVDDIAHLVDSSNDFGLKQSIIQSANHISFASTSADASDNLRRSAPEFAADIAAVVERCELIGLLAADVQAASSLREAQVLSAEIEKLTRENVEGGDGNGDGIAGDRPAEYGMAQLKTQLDAIVGREDPPYTVVDTWYLFNLVRLPNGIWVFDKLGRGGNIEGYK